MKNYKTSARITSYATRMIAVVLLVFMCCIVKLLDLYDQYRFPLGLNERIAILAGFYTCCLPIFLALWQMDKLMQNILAEKLFVGENVRLVRIVRWCCLAVSLICLRAAVGYPPLFFLALIMAFLALVVTVIGQMLKAAVAIQEENDLTV